MKKQTTIRDNQGYTYTAPEPSFQGATEDLTSCTKIKHPNLFIDMQSAYSYVQFLALFRIVEFLQPMICHNFNDGDISLQSKRIIWNHEERTVEVILPLKDFGMTPDHYKDLERALLAMSRIAVTFPQWSMLSQKELMTTGGLCRVAIDKTNRRSYKAHFFFHEAVIRNIINPKNGFSQILKETVDKIQSIYAAKLYFTICRWADKGKWSISYLALRSLLNIDSDRYQEYKDFRRRILKSSSEELVGSTNYWFSFYERFPAKSKNPDMIYFSIYSSLLDTQEKQDCHNRIEKIKAIGTQFGLTPRVMTQLTSRITPGNSKYIFDKHSELVAYMLDNINDIADQTAYYRQALQNIIYKDLYNITAVQTELIFSNPSKS